MQHIYVFVVEGQAQRQLGLSHKAGMMLAQFLVFITLSQDSCLPPDYSKELAEGTGCWGPNGIRNTVFWPVSTPQAVSLLQVPGCWGGQPSVTYTEKTAVRSRPELLEVSGGPRWRWCPDK